VYNYYFEGLLKQKKSIKDKIGIYTRRLFMLCQFVKIYNKNKNEDVRILLSPVEAPM